MSPTVTLIDEKEMPAPRLELRWEKMEGKAGTWLCTYALMLPLREHDIRREQDNFNATDNTLSLEIGQTEVDRGKGRSPLSADRIDTPFRDGAHARWDALTLAHFPVYAVCEGKAMLIPVEADATV